MQIAVQKSLSNWHVEDITYLDYDPQIDLILS